MPSISNSSPQTDRLRKVNEEGRLGEGGEPVIWSNRDNHFLVPDGCSPVLLSLLVFQKSPEIMILMFNNPIF